MGSGKTALVLRLCERLRDRLRIGVVTNDIFTREDAEFLHRHEALPAAHIRAVETGGCPHAAIREDIAPNLDALESLMKDVHPELLIVESGGDNLAAQYSRELADFTAYVIDVAGGDKVPRKGGPGITQSDLLIVNKTAALAELDLASDDPQRRLGRSPPSTREGSERLRPKLEALGAKHDDAGTYCRTRSSRPRRRAGAWSPPSRASNSSSTTTADVLYGLSMGSIPPSRRSGWRSPSG